MTLDPYVKRLLDAFASMNLPQFSEMKVEEVRKLMDENPVLEPKEEINREKDGTIELKDRKIPYRMYFPDDSPSPLILYFHGGGFVFGTIQSHENICRRLANSSGCRVMSVEYRLAPENKFPSAVEDAFESYSWVLENAGNLDVNTSRVALCGDSAGANISAALCLMLKDRNVKLPRLQVLFYPVVGADLTSSSHREYADGYFLTEDQQTWFAAQYLASLADTMNPYFAPITRSDLSGLPEAVIVTGEYDPLRDQGEAYLSKLYSAGVEATGLRANGMIHGFASFLNVIPAAHSFVTMVGNLIGQKLNKE